MVFICPNITFYCYICGRFNVGSRNVEKLTDTLFTVFVTSYPDFVVEISTYAPRQCCKNCANNIRQHVHKKVNLKFLRPVTWMNPGEHEATVCYFCINKPTQGKATLRRSKKNPLKVTPFVLLPTKAAGTPTADPDAAVGVAGPSNAVPGGAVAGPSSVSPDIALAASSNADHGADEIETDRSETSSHGAGKVSFFFFKENVIYLDGI